ncbi:MAG: prolyl oligopeptidase family serine peptidase [Acidobacteriota bacterium]
MNLNAQCGMSMRRFLIAFLCFAASGCASASMSQTGFLNRELTVGGITYRYVVYVPREYRPDRKWPVLLFLHGAGERGSDGLHQTQVGLGPAIRSNPDRFPMIVVMPQVPADQRWLEQPAEAAMLALDRSVAEFNGDSHRTYLTGLSMGGYGVWHLALAHPDRFAAIAPVCGGILPHDTAKSVRQSPLNSAAADPYMFTAEGIRSLKVWVFHGADDPIVPVSESRMMVKALREKQADVQYTEYPGVGHGSWEKAYSEEELWRWMLAQRK